MSKAPKAAKPPKKNAKHVGEETVSLRHDFTDKEYRDIGGKLNVSLNELTRLDGELKSISSDYKARIQQQEGQRDELNMKLGNGYEMRQTKVAVVYDPKRGVKTFYAVEDKRHRTALREEPMRPSDYQMEMPVAGLTGVAKAAGMAADAAAQASQAPAPGQPLVNVGEAVTDAEAIAGAKLVVSQAIEVIRSEGKASVSLIQRRLKIGYPVAVAIIDGLEKDGVIGPANGAEPRSILALPAPQPSGTPAHDTANPPPVPAKTKSAKRKPTKAEFREQQDGRSEGDK